VYCYQGEYLAVWSLYLPYSELASSSTAAVPE